MKVITKKDVVFYINKEKGVIVAKPKDVRFLSKLLDDIVESFNFECLSKPTTVSGIFNSNFYNYCEKIEKTSLSGKAKCDMEKDVFDEEVGKTIAYNRLKVKVVRIIQKAILEWLKDIRPDFEKIDKRLSKLYDIGFRASNEIEKYS